MSVTGLRHLSRVVSRVAPQKRAVFIGLSRCHGLKWAEHRKVQFPMTKHQRSPRPKLQKGAEEGGAREWNKAKQSEIKCNKVKQSSLRFGVVSGKQAPGFALNGESGKEREVGGHPAPGRWWRCIVKLS